MKNEELLYDLMYIKHNYDGVDSLYKKAKVYQSDIKRAYVKEWLNKQQTAQMNNDKVKKKEFLPIYSEAPYSFQIDLTFFNRYKNQNDSNYVLFTAINVNTRYAYAYYGKNKEMKTILNFLKKMEEKTVINVITCDEGSEFKNIEFQNFCKENDIKLFLVKDDSHKLGIINRYHRTLKNKLTKYFSAHDTVRWVDVLDNIVNNINHTVNRGIGIEPFKVNSFIENQIIQKAKEKTKDIEQKESEIKIGDLCRVRLIRTQFTDKMHAKWSDKVYVITKIKKGSVVIKDNNDEEYKAKRTDIKIIKEVENKKVLKEIVKANKEHTINNNIKKSGVEQENLVEGKRQRKKATKLDL
jgi:hypothetical protein